MPSVWPLARVDAAPRFSAGPIAQRLWGPFLSLGLCLLLGAAASDAAAAADQLAVPAKERAAQSAQGPLEFWLVEPNEGESAGGHTAIRIGERIYHVERRADGLIADRRTSRIRFEEVYRGLGNRRIEAIPLAFEPAAIRGLRSRLEARFYERGRRLDELDALEAQVAWLAHAQATGALTIDIPGLGLFSPLGDGTCQDVDRAAAAHLRTRLDAVPVRAALESMRADARRETETRLTRVLTTDAHEPASSFHSGPGGELRRLREATQKWAAIEVLSRCGTLDSARLRAVPAGMETFDPDRRARWRSAQQTLALRIAALVESDRPDVGLAILLAAARWSALDRSVTTGVLHVLDPFAEDRAGGNPSVTLATGTPPSWLPKVRAKRRGDWERALRDFEQGHGPLEAQLAALERTWHALKHAQEGRGRALQPRASLGASVAVRYAGADWTLPASPEVGGHLLVEARQTAKGRAEALRRVLRLDLGYRLLSRNCVTELTGELEVLALAAREHRGAKQVDAGFSAAGASFVPFLAARSVESAMAAGPRRVLPSAREIALDQTQLVDPGIRSRLRESMTLSSQQYRPNDGDSPFLFFSDGPVWTRPLIGAVNLGYGLGATALGLLAAPFDRGEDLQRGAQGILMSVPELFFFQIRQGSYPVVPPLEFIQ